MPENPKTEREAEIDRVNRWAHRLEMVWKAMEENGTPLTIRIEYIHKFVTSFNVLSKARRELAALDLPKRLIVEDANDTKAPASIDAEVQRLTQSLAVNDKKPAPNVDKS